MAQGMRSGGISLETKSKPANLEAQSNIHVAS